MTPLIIDGTRPDGTIAHGGRTPFYVFDPDRQDWISGPFRYRWFARLVAWLM